MSTFEKIIVSFIDDNINESDLMPSAGFIDSYISDPDSPSGSKEFFLVYDDRVRTKDSIRRARKFEKSRNIKRKYIKYVDGVPYYVYSFWVKPEISKLYNGVVTLSAEQKSKILQFWTVFDSIADTVLSNQVLTLSVAHAMPLADYREDAFDISAFTINKKGAVSNEIVPFILYLSQKDPLDRLFVFYSKFPPPKLPPEKFPPEKLPPEKLPPEKPLCFFFSFGFLKS